MQGLTSGWLLICLILNYNKMTTMITTDKELTKAIALSQVEEKLNTIDLDDDEAVAEYMSEFEYINLL